MAKGKAKKESNAKAGRRATRTIFNGFLLLLSLGVLGAWAWQGVYFLEIGESAVILRLGRFDRIEAKEGWNVHLPPPIEYHETVNTSGIRTEAFGARPSRTTPGSPSDAEESEIARGMRRDAIQTADSNIVNVAYELQYLVADPYAFAFGMADPGAILHDATEASVRDVIGKKTIDAVLSQDRRQIEAEAKTLLQNMLDGYFETVSLEGAFGIDKLNLEKPQAPEAVREAFADVVSAGQDEKRAQSAASGDAKEIVQRAQAEVAELHERAEAYKLAKRIEAEGEAARFVALLKEYQAAPEVTRRRLYLETMEEILPKVEKIVVEPDTVNLLPIMGLGGSAPAGGVR